MRCPRCKAPQVPQEGCIDCGCTLSDAEEIAQLRARVAELEQQLAEAQAIVIELDQYWLDKFAAWCKELPRELDGEGDGEDDAVDIYRDEALRDDEPTLAYAVEVKAGEKLLTGWERALPWAHYEAAIEEKTVATLVAELKGVGEGNETL